MANFLWGTPSRFEKIPRFTQPQVQGLNTILQQALSGLQGTPASYEPIAQQEMQRFQNEIVPGIAERYATTQGSRSGAFQGALSQAAQRLSTNLAGMGAQYNLANRGQLMNLLKIGLTPQEDVGYFGGRQGVAQTGLSSLAGGIGTSIPILASLLGESYLGRPGGMAAEKGTEYLIDLLRRLLSGSGVNQGGSFTYEQPNVT
jgi:hypothetical protein